MHFQNNKTDYHYKWGPGRTHNRQLQREQAIAERSLESLVTIKKSNTCPAAWDEMTGTDRLRWSAACKHFAYNPQAVGAEKLMSLIFSREGSHPTCLYQREDGMIMTTNCRAKQIGQFKKAGMIIVLVGILLSLSGFSVLMGGSKPVQATAEVPEVSVVKPSEKKENGETGQKAMPVLAGTSEKKIQNENEDEVPAWVGDMIDLQQADEPAFVAQNTLPASAAAAPIGPMPADSHAATTTYEQFAQNKGGHIPATTYEQFANSQAGPQ